MKRLPLGRSLLVFTVIGLGFLGLLQPIQAATSSQAEPVAETTQADGGSDGADAVAAGIDAVDGRYERAAVEGVTSGSQETTTTGQAVEVYEIRFLSGPEKGNLTKIANEVGSNPYGLQPRVGDKVVIFVQASLEGGFNYYIEGYDRLSPMIWLVIFFVLTMVLLSGWQGVKVSFSIILSVLLIGYVLIPLFLHGYNPVPIAIILSGALVFISTGLSTGWNKKSYMTAIGTIGGTLVAYGVSLIFARWSHLQGLSTEEDRLFFDKNPSLDPQALLFAGIIIASAGIIEDVAVSIASGVAEVRRANPRAGFRQLFRSGMVIGNDHMSALANTLVYVYVGGALSTLLLYKQFGGSWLKFANFDSVVDEVVRSLSGTIGLVFTVPITAILSAWVIHREQYAHTHVSNVPKDLDV